MKMTIRDRIIVLCLLLGIGLYGGYKLLWLPAGRSIAELEQKKTGVMGLAADISPVLKQTEALQNEEKDLQNAVSDVKGTGGMTVTKEDFLLTLGESTVKNNVKLIGFNDLGLQEKDGIYKAIFDFELQGTANNINSILNSIDNIGVRYSVGSMSYRQVAEFDYLKRFFDGITGLPWYKEPEKKEEETKIDDVLPPRDEFFGEPIPSIPDLAIPEEPARTPTPEQTPLPPEESKPTQPSEDKSIDERLDSLLQQTGSFGNYKIMLLTNNTENFDVGSEMRLAVTVCFIMFEKPSPATSYRNGIAEVL